MQKGSAALLLVVAVLVIGGVASFFYLSQTASKNIPIKNIPFKPSSTQRGESKIYQNDRLGFQFQYNDENFKVQEDSEEEFNQRGNGDFRKNFTSYITYPPAKVLGAVVVLTKEGSYETNPFTVWVFENPQNLDIEKWYLNFWYYPFVWGDYTDRRNNVAPSNDATVSGKLAKHGTVTYQPNSPKFVYLPSNEKMYLIRLIGEDGDQILSTLQFLPDQNMGSKGCIVGGCSGQLCVEESAEEIITTCEWREEYACYKDAICKRQSSGECGWAQTKELTKCLEERKGSTSDLVF